MHAKYLPRSPSSPRPARRGDGEITGPFRLVDVLRRANTEELSRCIAWVRDDEEGALGHLPASFACQGHTPLFLELLPYDDDGGYAWRLRSEREVFHGGELPGRYSRRGAKGFAVAAIALKVTRRST